MKTITILLASVFCISLNAQKGNLFISGWHENESAELNVPSDKYTFFKNGKLYYYLSNNDENIFIDIKVEDPGVQNRILKQGLTVWVNMDGKSSKITGVRFPIGSQYSGGRGRPNMPEVNVNPDGSLVTPLSLANTIELIGLPNDGPNRFPADNADNFRGSVKYDSEGNLFYKLIMPIAKLPVRNSKDGDGAMPFTLGIEYGAPPATARPGGAGAPQPISVPPSGGSRGGGGGRSGGGSRGSGGGGSGGSSSQNTTPPVLLWIKNFKLATL